MGSIASLSEKLRRERELRGVSLKQISEDTKIGVRFLEALEEGEIERIPGEFYRRSYLRAYARYLGLDEERAVNAYKYSAAVVGEGASHGDERSGETPTWVRFGLATAVLVIPAFLLFRPARTPEAPPTGARGSSPAESSGTAPGADEATAPPAPSAPDAATAPVAGIPSFPTAPSGSLDSAARPASVPLASGEGALVDGMNFVLAIEEACWLEVMVDGVVVVTGLKDVGFRQEFSARAEVRLWLGNAGGVRLWVNGSPMRPLGESGQVRKDVLITRTNYSEFVSGSRGTL